MSGSLTPPRRRLPDEAAVADYLARNPEFFVDHPELLSRLTLPHVRGDAISLWERQLEILRHENARLHALNADFLESARGNERLIAGIHRLALALLTARTARDALDRLHAGVADDFNADRVSTLLFAATPAPEGELPECVGVDSPRRVPFDSLLRAEAAHCGGLDTLQLAALFGLQGFSGSHVVFPLRGSGWDGVLAISSHDSTRFDGALGTEFLAFLRDVVARVLDRHLAGMPA